VSAIIELADVFFAYGEGPDALRGVSLRVGAGDYAILAGVNGSGKTTLLKMLIGLLRPDRGVVRVNGRDAAALSVGELARTVGFSFQQPERQLFCASVREEIAFGPRNFGLDGHELRARVDSVMARFGLEAHADAPPAVLSFSLRRLTALASVAALGAPVLVLDEPLAGLDGRWRGRVLDWLDAHQREGGTVLLVTHRLDEAYRADRLIVMSAGRVFADGAPGEVFADPDTIGAAGLRLPFAVALSHVLGIAPPALTVDALASALAEAVP
jgi:energy-coupling factor transport system ATP-binding protein